MNALGCCSFVAALLLFGSARAEKPLTTEQAREELAYTVGVQAYLYGYPVLEMYRVRHARVYDPANKFRTPLNHFRHMRRLLDHTDTTVVFPNNDTLYSGAWLDLAAEPVVLQIPDSRGRYYSFQCLDFFTNNFAVVGQRSPRVVVVAGPNWKGKIPEGSHVVRAPTNAVWLLGRILVEGKDDLKGAHAFQDGCSLTLLSAWGTSPKAPPVKPAPPAYDLTEPLKFFELLQVALCENPPPGREAALLSLFGQIGVSVDKPFRIDRLDAATQRGLRRALAMGPRILAAAPELGRSLANGWTTTLPHVGRFGDDYLYRAVVARHALAALTEEEVVYLRVNVDDQGKALNGRSKYVLRFDKSQLPPVDGFWSLTMYRAPESLLAANALGRYSIGDRTAGLRRSKDGSLEIVVAAETPGKDAEANWLPAPRGDFYLGLRCYLPHKDIASGKWTPPAVKRLP